MMGAVAPDSARRVGYGTSPPRAPISRTDVTQETQPTTVPAGREERVEREAGREAPACRSCGAPLERTFVDLGMAPLANSYLAPDALLDAETYFPLHVFLCTECFLVQLPAVTSAEAIFSDYAYFASYSESWLDHARRYVEAMSVRFEIGTEQTVVEVASNDGYLLQYFKQRGVPVLGVEPAANVAEAAEAAGIETVVKFFGEQTARELVAEGVTADLLIGNNVLAHVPNLNDFVRGLGIVLAPGGVLTMEFPHLLRLMEESQFDTIYHEHFSYFSLLAVERVFRANGLELFDVDELPTHGGSLRIFVQHPNTRAVSERVAALRDRELAAGLGGTEAYDRFAAQVEQVKLGLLEFVLRAKREGRTIAAYGAAAKGNTLLCYCGIGRDLIDYVVDRSPHKQGLHLPGTHIPIRAPEEVARTRPDYLLILPWNLSGEIMEQMAHVREFGCRFVTPIPGVLVHE
jgi:SAM-dependent methyltransferase